MKLERTGMRAVCFVALVAVVMVFASEAETVYTVEVDGGTAESPVKLDEQTVAVEKNGITQSKPFIEVCSNFDSGAIFRKRGTGWMMSSVKMAEFTGEIHVEEGAFMVNTNLMTGAMNKSIAPKVVVSDGASFVVAQSAKTCKNTEFKLYNHFHLKGAGVSGFGAVANFAGQSVANCFKSDWTLDGDALIGSKDSASRLGMNYSNTINMNGHTLTFRKGSEASSGWTFAVSSVNMASPGHIVIDGADLLVQGADRDKWDGSSANTVRLINGGKYSNYNTKISIPWTLIAEGDVKWTSTSSDEINSGLGNTNEWNCWSGPVVANGGIDLIMGATNYGFTVNGTLSGAGSILGHSGWLRLTKANPDFTGSLGMDDSYRKYFSGLALYDANAITPSASGLYFTNATLRSMVNGEYNFPKLELHVQTTNQTLHFPVTGVEAVGLERPVTATATGLKKTGAKTLSIEGGLSISGTLEVEEGCLELPGSQRSGFVTGWSGTVVKRPWCSDLAYGETRAYYTNSVVRAPYQLYSEAPGSLGYSNCVTWIGYVWNRTSSAQDWTFAFAVNRGVMFMVGGSRTNYWNASKYTEPKLQNITMQPGANLIGIRVYGLVDGGGARTTDELTKAQWRNGFGVAVDRQGRKSTNAADYEPLADPGDGSLISVSADGSFPDVEPEWRLSFSHLKIGANAVLEAKGSILALETVEGLGTIKNGTGHFKGELGISSLWKISAPQVGTEKTLNVQDGLIRFGEGCVLEIADIMPGAISIGKEYVIARASEGIVGTPVFSSSDPAMKCWKVEKMTEASGDTVLKFVWHKGLSISIR